MYMQLNCTRAAVHLAGSTACHASEGAYFGVLLRPAMCQHCCSTVLAASTDYSLLQCVLQLSHVSRVRLAVLHHRQYGGLHVSSTTGSPSVYPWRTVAGQRRPCAPRCCSTCDSTNSSSSSGAVCSGLAACDGMNQYTHQHTRACPLLAELTICVMWVMFGSQHTASAVAAAAAAGKVHLIGEMLRSGSGPGCWLVQLQLPPSLHTPTGPVPLLSC